MSTFSNNFGAKRAKKGQNEYNCDTCNFKCCKKYSWDRHILTSKHIKSTYSNSLATDQGQKGQILSCDVCGKEYTERTGLWRHKQKCKNIESNTEKTDSIDKEELIIQLLKQNAKLMEIIENGTHNTNNSHNTHTNSHNKAFNLNFFLNETCKNAMNITDFVDSIKLQLSDLMEVGELGYVEGISKIIVKNLNNLDETKRPIHCTDKKRETMYIKDNDIWEKEDEKKTKLKKAINKINDKNIRLLPKFREKYPDYNDSSSKISDIHDNLVIEVMNTNEDSKEKIIHNISKVTVITEK